MLHYRKHTFWTLLALAACGAVAKAEAVIGSAFSDSHASLSGRKGGGGAGYPQLVAALYK